VGQLRQQLAQEHTSLERMYLDLTANAEEAAALDPPAAL
jgi:hypothetical protein